MMLLGTSSPRRRGYGPGSRTVAVAALVLLLICAHVATAMAPTRTRMVKARHGVTLQPARMSGKKVVGRPGSAKSAARKPGSGKAGASHSAKAKNGAADKPLSKSRRKSRKDNEPPPDLPMMYRVRSGRYGRRPMLTVRGRQLAIRNAAVRAAAFAAAAAASPLRGNHDVLVHQNLMASGEGLERIQNEEQLDRLHMNNDLVDFTPSRSLMVNPALPYNRRCARQWTVQFAADLADDFYARFGEPIIITSAARSVEYQRRLAHVNGNAAGIEGDTASPHLTGQAIDIGKHGMSRVQLKWMRDHLLPLMQTGEIDVEEEFRQACFHISVYRSYLPPELLPPMKLAQAPVGVGADFGQTQP